MGNNVSARRTVVQRDRACGVLLGAAAGASAVGMMDKNPKFKPSTRWSQGEDGEICDGVVRPVDTD